MKILITGANSYIGASFEKYLKDNSPESSEIDTIDMQNPTWEQISFSDYDVVFHVAGIAHIKETLENAQLYYDVNRDLAIKVAKKAKADGVKQFIFLSSMSIYGMDSGVITKDTKPQPKSHYGRSKLQAEEGILPLRDEEFKVVVLRPPMVFGPGCKGNYQQITKIVEKFPVFPRLKNQRSLIYIDNLSSFVKLAIDKSLDGIYFPDNAERVDTYSLARAIAEAKNRKVWFSRLLGLAAMMARYVIPKANKAFGSLIYEGVEDFCYSYCVVNKEDSLRLSAEQR